MSKAGGRCWTKQMPDIIERFVAFLNAQTDVPVISPWGETLWTAGLQHGGIQPLESFGDCLGAWLVNEEFDWLGLVQSLLQHGEIDFPRQSSTDADMNQMSFLARQET